MQRTHLLHLSNLLTSAKVRQARQNERARQGYTREGVERSDTSLADNETREQYFAAGKGTFFSARTGYYQFASRLDYLLAIDTKTQKKHQICLVSMENVVHLRLFNIINHIHLLWTRENYLTRFLMLNH